MVATDIVFVNGIGFKFIDIKLVSNSPTLF